MLIEFARQGVDPHMVKWFYYDNDWSRDADESYSFFAVHGGKIVMESCHFSSEEPLILKRKLDDDPVWHSHPRFEEAWERYWYRRFYSETVTGQLMVLRPDEPILYHHERPQARDSMREVLFVTLSNAAKALGVFFWIGILVLLLDSWPGSHLDRWTDKAWYSFRYSADLKNVTVDKRPLDCDFFYAPVGDKGCHYKKADTIFSDEQRRALIQRASTTDEQKAYQEQPNSVAVYWEKEEQ